MTNKERLEILADKVRQAKRFIQNGERGFKGEQRQKKAQAFMQILDETGVNYTLTEFKKMIILSPVDVEENHETDEYKIMN